MFKIDNYVLEEVRDAMLPPGWKRVRLRKRIAGLYQNDTVEYQLAGWRVFKIDGDTLVLKVIGT